jgi:hypothetical protein
MATKIRIIGSEHGDAWLEGEFDGKKPIWYHNLKGHDFEVYPFFRGDQLWYKVASLGKSIHGDDVVEM